MIELRYYIEKNHVTADQVREYSLEMQVPMMEAKEMLVNATKPVLQYREMRQVRNMKSADVGKMRWSEWKTVPTVISVSSQTH